MLRKFWTSMVLYAPDPTGGGGGGGAGTPPDAGSDTAKETPKQELERLRKENAELKAAKAQQDADEKLITEKTRAGLTRDQAKAVIRRQRDHDAAMEKIWAERRPEIVAALKDHDCLEGRITKDARTAIREINGSITIDEIKKAQESVAKK